MGRGWDPACGEKAVEELGGPFYGVDSVQNRFVGGEWRIWVERRAGVSTGIVVEFAVVDAVAPRCKPVSSD